MMFLFALAGAMSAVAQTAQAWSDNSVGYSSAASLGVPQYKCVRNWYLSPQGSDANTGTSPASPWATLEQADKNVKPGDCVNLGSGTYALTPGPRGNEPLILVNGGDANTPTGYVVYRSSTPRGARITLSEPIKQQPVGHWQQFPPMITAKGNYLIFDALDIDGDDDARNAKAIGGCITNGGSHHLVVENSVVHGCGSAGIAANSDYMWIINNLVYDNAHYDTYFEGSGIDSYEPRAANIHHPEFVPNENDKALKYHTTIAFNVVHDNYIGKECHPSFPPNPQGCGTNGGDGHTDGNGIMLDDWQHTQSDNKPYTGGALVLGNIVYNNGAGGLVIFETANVMAVNNTSYNNFTDPLNSGDHRGDISCSICFNTQFINNASHAVVGSAPPYSFNSGYACEPESKDVTFTTNIGHEKAIRCTFSGTGNLFNADPQFVDPGKGNFNLTPGSPAMRSGTRQPWLKPSRPNRGQVQGVRRRSRSNGQ